jgi:hypothetical protein
MKQGVGPWLVEIFRGIKNMDGGLVCCNFEWDKPNHLERAWMLWEAYATIACGRPITLALSAEETQKLVEKFRQVNGPQTLLNIVSKLEANPALTKCSVEADKILLVQDMQRLSHQAFPNSDHPNRKMSQTLANATRVAYAVRNFSSFCPILFTLLNFDTHYWFQYRLLSVKYF